MDNAVKFTDDNFKKQVLGDDGVVLVDFWATWCGPCQVMGPIVDEVAEKLAGEIKVGKLNVDENKEAAAKYNIRSIPSLLIFKNGELIEQLLGVQAKETLVEKLRMIAKDEK